MAKKASQHQQWVDAVRLPDGDLRYLCPPGSRRGGQDQWSPRVGQATVWSTKDEAERVAAPMETSATAKEYLVLPLSKATPR